MQRRVNFVKATAVNAAAARVLASGNACWEHTVDKRFDQACGRKVLRCNNSGSMFVYYDVHDKEVKACWSEGNGDIDFESADTNAQVPINSTDGAFRAMLRKSGAVIPTWADIAYLIGD